MARPIPARAGRTETNCWPSHVNAGHPCACRENKEKLLEIQKQDGSSLRVQGERTTAR